MSNLLKQMFTVIQEDEKRVIDTNALLQRRQEERQRMEEGGFAVGLAAEELTAEEFEEAGGSGGNVLKAQEDARQILARAREDADAVLGDAKAQADRIHEEARAQAEAEKSRILTEAKQQGYSEGLRKAQAEEQKLKLNYQEKERKLEAFYQQQIDELEPRLVDAITAIYQHVFDVELSSNHDILIYLISSALKTVDGGRELLIHVSKEDYPYVSMQKKQLLAGAVSANCSVETVEDITLAKNECLIETENGIFDCGLGTQLAELRQKLMLLSWSGED